MADFEKFWLTYPYTVDKGDYLRQVGKTVNGKPIPKQQIDLIISRIRKILGLGTEDLLLDICCGNGLFTHSFAEDCRIVYGMDFSIPLLEVAKRDHNPDNVEYYLMNILEIGKDSQKVFSPVNKILMYDALQHFKIKDFNQILLNIKKISKDTYKIFIGGIPDIKRKWRFYDTPRKKYSHIRRLLTGKEQIKTWWDREYIDKVCENFNLKCEFFTQDSDLYSSGYRFDVLIQQT